MALSDYFASQAEWRRHKAEEYPEDARNAQSARALESLAAFVARDEEGHSEAGAIVDALEKHMFDEDSFGGEEAERAVSRYGFGYEVNFTHHIDFLDELWVLATRDVYRDVGDSWHGEDPTETLFDFEIEAAINRVYLPSQYWEQRRNRTPDELEAAVVAYSEREKAQSALDACGDPEKLRAARDLLSD